MKRLIPSHDFRRKTAGFTMLELSMSILIVGLLFSAVVSLYASYYKKQQQESIYEELAAVQNALKTFARTNGRYPCPANPTLTVTDAGAAVEVDCTIAAPTGITVVGTGSTAVWIGAVPVNTIGLGTGYQKDGYNFKYLYAISKALTDDGSIPAPPAVEPAGVISVVDQANNNVLDTAGTARFIVASFGSTSMGAYTMSGQQKSACPAATVRENENCDGTDATFMMAPILEETGNNFFDDYVIYDQSISKADPSLAEKLALCNSKRMFFKPSDALADTDGCVDMPGTLEGACIERIDDYVYDYAGTWNDLPEEFFISTSVTPTTAFVVSAPASLTGGGRCTCPGGYINAVDSKLGTWASPMDTGGTAGSPKFRVDTLYVCIRT